MFTTMHHTNTIRNVLSSGDLRECFTYSERTRTTHKNFLRPKVKVFAKIPHKMIKDSEAWQSCSRDMNFKNPLESHFSFNKKCFVDRTVMIQSALHFPDLRECFIYSERMRTTHRKVSTGFWSQSLRQNLTQNDRIFWSLAELQRFEFQKSTRKSLFLQ